MKKRFFTIMLSAVLALSVCGCAKEAEVEEDAVVTEAPTPTPTEEPVPTPTPVPLKAIGAESTADTVFCVILKNSTGLDITGVSVKLMEDEEFSENMLAEGDVFVVDEERNLFYDSAVAAEEETEEADSDEKLLEPGYDVQITFADETTKVLHAFPFGDIEAGELCLEDEVAFVKYTNVSAGEEVSTKEAEIAVKESEEAAARAAAEAAERQAEAEAAARAEAERQAAAEAAARAEAERQAAEAAAREEAERQAAESAPAPEAPAPEAPAQDAESCLGDDALTW